MKRFRKVRQMAQNPLDWSTRVLKTDTRYLARGGFWLGGSRVIQTLAGLGLAVAFANLVAPEVYGTYKFILAMAGIIGAFSLTGIKPAMIRSVAKGFDGAFRDGFFASVRWSIPMIVIALGASVYYFLNENTTLALAMLFIAFFLPLRYVFQISNYYLIGKKNFRFLSTSSTIREIATVLFLVGTMLLIPGSSPLVFVGVFLVLGVFFSFSILLYVYRKYRPKGLADPELVPYSKHMSVIGGIQTVGDHLDKVLIFHFLGAVPVALYAFALLPANKTRSFLQVLNPLLLPKFSNRSIQELQKSITKKALVLFLLSFLVMVFLLLIIPFVFRAVIPEYTQAIPYAQLFSVSLLFTPAILYDQALSAHAKKKELYLVRISSNIVRIALLLALLPILGILGGLYALIIFFAFKLTISMFYFYRIPHQPSE